MRKPGWLWEGLLPALICLCPMGAVAYYTATAEHEVPDQDPASTKRNDLASRPPTGLAAVSIARS
jgi:hypothetical protein